MKIGKKEEEEDEKFNEWETWRNTKKETEVINKKWKGEGSGGKTKNTDGGEGGGKEEEEGGGGEKYVPSH